MYSSWLEEVRFKLETVEVLQNAITKEMLFIHENPK